MRRDASVKRLTRDVARQMVSLAAEYDRVGLGIRTERKGQDSDDGFERNE